MSSHRELQRARAAVESGAFNDEIVPVIKLVRVKFVDKDEEPFSVDLESSKTQSCIR